MQLLPSCPLPIPQFASLSILLENRQAMVEPLFTISNTSSIDRDTARNALRELHMHILSTVSEQQTGVAAQILKEDQAQLKTTQIFRPQSAHGVALCYKVIREPELQQKIQHMVQASNINAPNISTIKSDPNKRIAGALIAVAISGLPTAFGGSYTAYGIAQRLSDCCGYLAHQPRFHELTSVKSLLSTFLLSEDDYKTTNEMQACPNLFVFPEEVDEHRRNLLSPIGMISPIAEFGRNTARRASMATGLGRGKQEAADTGPTQVGIPLQLTPPSAEASRALTEQLTVLSLVETDSQLRTYKQTSQERKANLDLTTGTKSRFRRREGKDADFDCFDYKGPVRNGSSTTSTTSSTKLASPLPEKTSFLKSSRKDTRRGPASRRMSTAHATKPSDDDSHQGSHTTATTATKSFDPFRRTELDDDGTINSGMRSHNDNSSTMSQAKLSVHLALNEDVSCSYKQSQLSSCVVEGILQVQVKCNARSSGIPFVLQLKDPSGHLDKLSENQKYAEIVKRRKEVADLNITLPKQDMYFPVLKYKCGPDLRPVPLRVQTKVKAEAGHCRVALQISSNPNNESSLTDLTIVMGVSDCVVGESVATQPSGGVWDKSKSSVIWCVSELGRGEKFQLQARFVLQEKSVSEIHFPVLVRCQCLQRQLSDIAFDVRERADLFPTEVSTDMARRYRLSHREKH